MRKRKLMPSAVLEDIATKHSFGIPLTKIVETGRYDISRPALSLLIRTYNHVGNSTVKASLFPDWLDQDGDTVQEQPNNFVYIGKFPDGEWHEVY